jgi:hypothetical protein
MVYSLFAVLEIWNSVSSVSHDTPTKTLNRVEGQYQNDQTTLHMATAVKYPSLTIADVCISKFD